MVKTTAGFLERYAKVPVLRGSFEGDRFVKPGEPLEMGKLGVQAVGKFDPVLGKLVQGDHSFGFHRCKDCMISGYLPWE